METRYGIGAIKAVQTTPEGYQRGYVRLALADHPYTYFNRDGTKRIERITTDDLFSPPSVSTAKSLPTLIGHPAFKFDSATANGNIHGTLGENFVREDTDKGSFLGTTVTLYTDEAKRRSAELPGVSPGYGVRIDRQDGVNYQRDRQYNHLAVAVVPRGGDDVRQMFEGIRVDAVEDSPIWVARYDDCYECDFDKEWIGQVLNRRDEGGNLLEKTPVDLTPHVSRSGDEHRTDDETCDCEKCTAKKKKSTRGVGFGSDGTSKRKKKTMGTTSLQVDGITYEEVPLALAQVVMPKLQRLDALEQSADKSRTDAADLQTRLDEAEAAVIGLAELNEALEAQIADRDDSESEDDGQIRYTEDEVSELVYDYAQDLAGAVDQIRSDAALLKANGLLADYNSDFDYVSQNMDSVQREMILAVTPQAETRLDGYNDDAEKLAQDYEITFSTVRDTLKTRQNQDSAGQGGLSPLQMAGSMLRHDGNAPAMKRPKGLRKLPKSVQSELAAQNSAFDADTELAAKSNKPYGKY